MGYFFVLLLSVIIVFLSFESVSCAGTPIHSSKDSSDVSRVVNAFQKIGSGAGVGGPGSSYGGGGIHPNDIMGSMPGSSGIMMRPTKIGRPFCNCFAWGCFMTKIRVG